jgi:NAD(P)-dependent dehydrogenase (short-subunit alcohol dehydrogenase family)
MYAMQQGGSVLVTGGGDGISGAGALHLVGRGLDLLAGVGDLDTIQAVSLDVRRPMEVDVVGQVAGVALQDAP